MTSRTTAGQDSRQAYSTGLDADLLRSISHAFGRVTPQHESLNEAFYAGLRPIVTGLKDGTLTEKQAALLIELMAAAYVGATVNQQIDSLFQNWAERLTTTGLGEISGRR